MAAGQEIDHLRLEQLRAKAQDDKAYGNALRYVAMRPRSEWELRTYLQRKQVEEPVAADIMQKLRLLDLLDDRAFATSWVANRRLLKAVSIRRLRQELVAKRVSEDIIAEVLGHDETDDRTVLRQLIAKKRSRYPDNTKLMQYAARQGFGYDDIKAVLDSMDD